jgi:hypothetical protein
MRNADLLFVLREVTSRKFMLNMELRTRTSSFNDEDTQTCVSRGTTSQCNIPKTIEEYRVKLLITP